MRLTLLLLALAAISCNTRAKREQNKKAAIALTGEAMLLTSFIDNGDSVSKALALLDRATSLDSTYIPAHDGKLMYYSSRKEYGKAIETIKIMNRLQPTENKFLSTGILYEAIHDSVSARPYFEKSLSMCNAILDTMKPQNPDHVTIVSHKAANLLMMGDRTKSLAILKALYDNEKDEEMKNIIRNFAKKNKQELIVEWIGK